MNGFASRRPAHALRALSVAFPFIAAVLADQLGAPLQVAQAGALVAGLALGYPPDRLLICLLSRLFLVRVCGSQPMCRIADTLGAEKVLDWHLIGWVEKRVARRSLAALATELP